MAGGETVKQTFISAITTYLSINQNNVACICFYVLYDGFLYISDVCNIYMYMIQSLTLRINIVIQIVLQTAH